MGNKIGTTNNAGIKLMGLIILFTPNILKPIVNNKIPPTLVISVTNPGVINCLNEPARITKNDCNIKTTGTNH